MADAQAANPVDGDEAVRGGEGWGSGRYGLGRAYLTFVCPDRKGIAAAVTGFLADADCFIEEAAQHGEASSGRFFSRIAFSRGGDTPSLIALRGYFQECVAERFGMEWEMRDADRPLRLLVLASKFGHCLSDLLHRHKAGLLPVAIPAVASNWPDLRSLVEWHGIPYHHLPVDSSDPAAQEARLLALADSVGAECLVLARYMRVLSPAACAAWSGRCINIHHSFLPGFKGAKPYTRAWERGVKIIGATAHYATADLDEGPIIEQAVERVDHAHGPDGLAAAGRDLETVVLARAVKWHAERRILIDGARTVVFR